MNEGWTVDLMIERVGFVAVVVGALLLGGCAARTSGSAGGGAISGGAVTTAGVKSAAQVAPCCRDLAAGRITLAECMERPECRANNRQCCMNAF